MRIIFSLILVFCLQASWAQLNSPYSKYGLGYLYEQQFANTYATGNAGIGFQDFRTANPLNPASYGKLILTTFDVGLNTTYLKAEDKTASVKNTELLPAYISMGIPIIFKKKKWSWATGFSLMPGSRKDYTFTNALDPNATNGAVKDLYMGRGTMYKFIWGNGFRINKFYVGANLVYNWGYYKQTTFITYPDSLLILNTQTDKANFRKGFTTQLGAQYDFKLNENSNLVLGMTYQLQSKIKDKYSQGWYRVNESLYVIDTISYVQDSVGHTTMPSAVNFGLTYNYKNSFKFLADFKSTQWNSFLNYGAKDSVQNSWQIGAGAQFVPNAKASNYFSKCNYKLGFYYGLDYIYIKNTPINNYGFTTGIGFPVRVVDNGRLNTIYLNTSLVSGTRGTLDNKMVKESYVKFVIGVSVSGRWFDPYKYE